MAAEHIERAHTNAPLAALAAAALLSVLFAFTGCSRAGTVVLETSVEQSYSGPLVRACEKATGVHVEVRYVRDEPLAAGTLKPRNASGADVYWDAGILETLRLAKAGALQPFEARAAADLPYAYRDTDHLWTMIGFRARVLLMNEALAHRDGPSSILQLATPEWAGRSCTASPMASEGALAQAAALYQNLGRDRARAYYSALAAGGVRFEPSDAAAAALVAGGKLAVALVGSDAAARALKKTPGLAVVLPDRDGLGTLYVPSTVALLKGAPHPAAAKKLIGYLLSPGTDEALVRSGFLAATVRKPPTGMQVSWPTAADQMDLVRADMKAILTKAPASPKK